MAWTNFVIRLNFLSSLTIVQLFGYSHCMVEFKTANDNVVMCWNQASDTLFLIRKFIAVFQRRECVNDLTRDYILW